MLKYCSAETSQHVSQMLLTEDDDMIEAFACNSAKKPLADRIHPRRAWRDLHDLDIGAFSESVECRTIPSTTVCHVAPSRPDDA